MALPKLKTEETFCYGDYLTWPDEERWELINGQAFNMSPAPTRRHQKILRELAMQISNFLLDKTCELYFAPFDVRLPDTAEEKDDDIENVVQPDIVVVCDPEKLDEKGCRGAPDLVIEILSPSTAYKDMKIKHALYEKHGVREFWLVHPNDNLVMIFRMGDDKMFGKSEVFAPEDKIQSAVLKALELDLELVFKETSPGE